MVVVVIVWCMQQAKKRRYVLLVWTKQSQDTIGSYNSMGAHAEPKKNRTQKKKIELGTELGWASWLIELGTLVQGQRAQAGKRKEERKKEM